MDGKISVEKGGKFEEEVAELYRLLGAEIKQDYNICGKQIDILATFKIPGSNIEHRIIVECKGAEKPRAQTTTVREFDSILKDARKKGDADSAEFITLVPWGHKAKALAQEKGIQLLTYAEKKAQLIDFTEYLKDMIIKFEENDPNRPNETPLGKYFVYLSAKIFEDEKDRYIPNINNYIEQWMQQDNMDEHLIILGGYGTGKTSLCKKIAHDLAVQYLRAPGSSRIPILVNLYEFTKTMEIESLIAYFLDRHCGATNPRYELFRTMNDAGVFLLILDGLDEMAQRMHEDTLEMNLQEIEKLASSAKSRIIITCRTEHFVSKKEEIDSFFPQKFLLASRKVKYRPLRILTWNDMQINRFLERRMPLIKKVKHNWIYYRDLIRNVPGLSDLSGRPVFLDMIVRSLPELISGRKSISCPDLYETFLFREIKRQKIQEKRYLLLSKNKRFLLLERLALDFYIDKMSAITFDGASNIIREIISPPEDELETYTRDFLEYSFLRREEDEYQFSHPSILAYIIARILAREIQDNIPDIFGRKPLDPLVTEFLTEFNPRKDRLWNWIVSTKSGIKEELKYLGGNAATLLCRLDNTALNGKNLSGTVLIGANLSSMDLKGTDFSHADLRGINLNRTNIEDANLTGAKFSKRDLEPAELLNATLSIYILGKIPLPKERKKMDYMSVPRSYLADSLEKIQPPISVNWTYAPEGYILGTLVLRVPDKNSLQWIRSSLKAQLWIKGISFYAEEHKRFSTMLPKSLLFQFQNEL